MIKQQERKNKQLIVFYIISSILTGIFSIIAFMVLGSFYNASDNVILVNILVWSASVFITYCIIFALYLAVISIFNLFKKNKLSLVPFLNGYAIGSGFLSNVIVCLLRAKSITDISYLEIFSFIAGIVPFVIQIFYSIKNKNDIKE